MEIPARKQTKPNTTSTKTRHPEYIRMTYARQVEQRAAAIGAHSRGHGPKRSHRARRMMKPSIRNRTRCASAIPVRRMESRGKTQAQRHAEQKRDEEHLLEFRLGERVHDRGGDDAQKEIHYR